MRFNRCMVRTSSGLPDPDSHPHAVAQFGVPAVPLPVDFARLGVGGVVRVEEQESVELVNSLPQLVEAFDRFRKSTRATAAIVR
jgi:hypothetical protein